MLITKWLDTVLGQDIWNNKYRYKDIEKKIEESFDEWAKRVSGRNKHIEKLILDKKFLFGGRILANRGLEKYGIKVTYSNCFLSGTKVITKRGLIDIQDIKKGDYVITDDNTWQKVNNVMKRDYEGDIYEITPYHNFKTILCTPNHKFLTEDGWVRADNLVSLKHDKKHYRTCHSLKTPTLNFEIEPFEIKLSDYFSDNEKTELLFLDNDEVCTRTWFTGGNGANGARNSSKIKNTILINDEIQYLLGRYIGDGSITRRKEASNDSIFQIVFNATDEQENFNKCCEIIKKYFTENISSTINKNQNTLILRVENPILGEFIRKYIGKGCENKRIPNELIGSLSLIKGIIDSDGCVLKSQAIKLTMKNKQLLEDVRESLLLNGIVTSDIEDIKQSLSNEYRTYTASKLYIPTGFSKLKLLELLTKKYDDDRMNPKKTNKPHFTKLINNELFVNIDKINILENQKTTVFNISVENVHSYTVNGYVAHNCYVLSEPNDNIESIFDCAKNLARTFSYGGGVGIDISKLSPRGAKIKNTAKHTTGAVSFMDLYSLVTELIGQEGRRAALMISLDCSHPDVEEFIDVKSDLNKVTKANISIKVTNDFMKAVENNEDWKLSYTRKETSHTIEKVVKAKDLFHTLAKMNWDYAEPGVLFWDKICDWNLLSEDENFEFAGVNPCA